MDLRTRSFVATPLAGGYPVPGKAPDKLASLEAVAAAAALVPEPAPALARRMHSLPLDEKDTPVLAAAVASRSDLLVTGDRRHFGHLYGQQVSGVAVVSPAQAFDLLLPP